MDSKQTENPLLPFMERVSSKYLIDKTIQIAKEEDEFCPSWEINERHPLVILRPPWHHITEWECGIKCVSKDPKIPYLCPICEGFPKTEKRLLKELLDDLKPKASQELQRSDSLDQPMDRVSEQREDVR